MKPWRLLTIIFKTIINNVGPIMAKIWNFITIFYYLTSGDFQCLFSECVTFSNNQVIICQFIYEELSEHTKTWHALSTECNSAQKPITIRLEVIYDLYIIIIIYIWFDIMTHYLVVTYPRFELRLGQIVGFDVDFDKLAARNWPDNAIESQK